MAARKRNKKRILDSDAIERPEPQLDLFADAQDGRATRYYFSTRLENLVDALARELRVTRPEDFFSRAPGLWVPNRNLRRWIQMSLAEREGVAAHLDFQFLEAGLWQLLLALDPEQERPLPVDRVDLEYLVLSELQEAVAGSDPVFAPFRDYLIAGHAARPPGVEDPSIPGSRYKLYQLAERLAALFQEYEYHRGDMVAEWLEVAAPSGPALENFPQRLNANSDPKPGANSEAKSAAIYVAERALYRRVFGVGGDREGGRVRALDRFGDRSLSLAAYARSVLIERRDRIRPLDRTVHVFGMSQMSVFHLGLMGELSEWLDLRFYLNFAPQHWQRALGKPRFAPADSGAPVDFASRWNECRVDSADTTHSITPRRANPEASVADRLNELWARPARELLQLLAAHRREHHRFFWDAGDREAFDGVAAGQTESVLRALQRELLYGPNSSPSESEVEENREAARLQDASIQIIGCPGLRREAETIYQNILFQMKREPGLRLTDIAVLVPDMQSYRPVLQAVFDADRGPDGGLRVPYNLSDFSAGDASVYGAGVATLLGLADSEFTRRELFALFFNPCFLTAHGLRREDALAWLDWADALQIYRAMDAKHQQELGIQADRRFTWERALRRLRLGTVMTAPRKPGEFRSFESLVPYSDLASGEGDSIGVLSAICSDLFLSLRECAAAFARNDLRAFDYLRDILDRHLQAPEDRPGEAGVRVGAMSALHRMSRHALATGRAPGFALTREILNARIGGVAGNRGNYLAGGVTIAALQPMRPIPFRIVYVPGMGEGDFPGHPDLSVLNLRNLERRAGDASVPESNRMLFLENLLSVRDRLYLSYVSRDIQRDTDYHPCSVLTELKTALTRFCDGEAALEYRETRVPLRLTGEEHLFFEAGDESDALACYSDSDRVLALRRFLGRNPEAAAREPGLFALLEKFSGKPTRPGIDGIAERKPANSATSRDGEAKETKPVAVRDANANDGVLRLRDLVEFLRDPAGALLRRRLGLFDEGRHGGRILVEEDEQLFLDARARRSFLRQALTLGIREFAGAPEPRALPEFFEELFEDARERDQMPRGAFGELERATLSREFSERVRRIAAACGEVEWLPELRFGQGDRRGALGSFSARPPVHAPAWSLQDQASRELHGSVSNLFLRPAGADDGERPAGDLYAGIMELSFASRVRTEDFLAGYLAALLLRAWSHENESVLPALLADAARRPFEVLVVARNETRKMMVDVAPTLCADYLRDLAADFTQGRFDTLPLALIEHRAVTRKPHVSAASTKPRNKTKSEPELSYADELRNVWEDHGDDFFQMELARLLPARFPADAETVVRRRYEIFFACLSAAREAAAK